MCGFVGIIGNNSVAQELYDSLIALQHRGQDAAGMITADGQFHLKKGLGLVRDVFDEKNMTTLEGNFGIGHVRYSTVGGGSLEDAQPFYTHSPYGLAMAHNGNLYNFHELKKELADKDKRHVNSNNDVEAILQVFANGMAQSKEKEIEAQIVEGVKQVYDRCKGSYSVCALISGHGLVAFRDPMGIRPMVWGKRGEDKQAEYIFSSEDTMYDQLEFEYQGDVQPGEVFFINEKKEVFSKVVKKNGFHPCIFEYVYFSRPDSFLNDVNVYRARLRMGQNLAKKITKELPDLKIDRVIPAPSTSTTAAMALAHELGLRYSEGLVKNRYIGRSFIMPDQKSRRTTIKHKLSTIGTEFLDNNVLIVDDSLVRGNTSKKIVDLARKAGAKKVYFAVTSPPVVCPCVYGIDIPTRQELIASSLKIEEIKNMLGADELIYLDLEDLEEAVVRRGKYKFKPCTACFSCQYPHKDINEEVLKNMEESRTQERDGGGDKKTARLL